MPGQSAADPVAFVHDWLKNHARIGDVLGGADHVSGLDETPWPHVAVADGFNGDVRDMHYEGEFEVTLEVTGAPNGAPGQAALWRTTMDVLELVCSIPEDARPTVTDPVVSKARPNGVPAWTPMQNGQPRYVIGVLITIRPPLA